MYNNSSDKIYTTSLRTFYIPLEIKVRQYFFSLYYRYSYVTLKRALDISVLCVCEHPFMANNVNV